MKIKVYFITYRNNTELSKTIKSFEDSGITKYEYEIFIINNSIDFPVEINTILNYRVILNETRPCFSTGHLSRNWNECLIDGFKDVNNPNCDIVILSQNDNYFLPNCIETIIEGHKKYSFIQNGHGDSFHSYAVDSIKKVGLWDERFCNIGFQEADYFLRQRLFNPNCSIKDIRHGRIFNGIDKDIVNYSKLTGWDREDINHHESAKYHKLSGKIFRMKYDGFNPRDWDGNFPGIHNQQAILYPYFEDKFAFNNLNYLEY